jgi:hypothetical protein
MRREYRPYLLFIHLNRLQWRNGHEPLGNLNIPEVRCTERLTKVSMPAVDLSNLWPKLFCTLMSGVMAHCVASRRSLAVT